MVEVKVLFLDGSYCFETIPSMDDWMKKMSKLVENKSVISTHPNSEGVITFSPYHQILRIEVRTLKDENP